MAEALGVEERTPARARAALKRALLDLNRAVGMDKGLAELGVTRAELHDLAVKAAQDPA